LVVHIHLPIQSRNRTYRHDTVNRLVVILSPSEESKPRARESRRTRRRLLLPLCFGIQLPPPPPHLAATLYSTGLQLLISSHIYTRPPNLFSEREI
uniref:Uncharacterized protein n=1 Tax=Aegilops tauschii subsp. strangulata TaxID=200361 RepID=A0A453IFR9_AEGTS